MDVYYHSQNMIALVYDEYRSPEVIWLLQFGKTKKIKRSSMYIKSTTALNHEHFDFRLIL